MKPNAPTKEMYAYLAGRIRVHTEQLSRRVLNRMSDSKIEIAAAGLANRDLLQAYGLTTSELVEMILEENFM